MMNDEFLPFRLPLIIPHLFITYRFRGFEPLKGKHLNLHLPFLINKDHISAFVTF